MEGYVYLDIDDNLVRKDKDYVDNMNPLFFSDNKAYIVRKWSFNTDDRANMMSMLRTFKDLRIETVKVLVFLKDINFDINVLKEPQKNNANTIQ